MPYLYLDQNIYIYVLKDSIRYNIFEYSKAGKKHLLINHRSGPTAAFASFGPEARAFRPFYDRMPIGVKRSWLAEKPGISFKISFSKDTQGSGIEMNAVRFQG